MATAYHLQVLQKELLRRQKNNPKYSLRAFSAFLKISPAQLSQVLRSKQGLSRSKAAEIAERLKLGTAASNKFVLSVSASDSRSKQERSAASQKLQDLQQGERPFTVLSEQAFAPIASWEYLTVMELFLIPDGPRTTATIAERLGTSHESTQNLLNKMQNHNYVCFRGGRYELVPCRITTTNSIPAEAIRSFNKKILQKSLLAIDEQSITERDISTLTVAIHHELFPIIQQKITSFRRELNAWIEASYETQPPDQVYCLATQFFSLLKSAPKDSTHEH